MIHVPGILVIYNHPLRKSAATIMEHAGCFKKYSQYPVWMLNTETGFPPALLNYQFACVVVHYSYFGWFHFPDTCPFKKYLSQSASYKVAFFQDEYRYCQKRFAFVNDGGFQGVYTLVDPRYLDVTYRKHTKATDIFSTIPGMVDDVHREWGRQPRIPEPEKKIDVGYRGRELDFWFGRGGQEKSDIARGFLKHAQSLNLKLDIQTSETSRIYGAAWLDFIRNSRATLGVESGTSIFDVDGTIEPQCSAYLKAHPQASFADISAAVLHKYEETIPYRTISPRHFEAIALDSCQILFEGDYSGILEPLKHYIPLKKDFSNFDEVMRMFKDVPLREKIQAQAFQDVILSERHTYKTFVRQFEEHLQTRGLKLDVCGEKTKVLETDVEAALRQNYTLRWLKAYSLSAEFPGRKPLVYVAKNVFGWRRKT